MPTNFEELEQQLGSAEAFLSKELIRRPEWGSSNFVEVEALLARFHEEIKELGALPLQHLSETAQDTLATLIGRVNGQLSKINKFKELAGNANPVRTGILDQIPQVIQAFLEFANCVMAAINRALADIPRDRVRLRAAEFGIGMAHLVDQRRHQPMHQRLSGAE